MISLITLAHRVSSIHKKYAGIHAALYSFSLPQIKYMFGLGGKPDYCSLEIELVELGRELSEARAVLGGEEQLQPADTIGREFAFALDVYIIALSDAVEVLSSICRRRCRDSKGLEKYSEKQDLADRQDYDHRVQQYRRLGERLTYHFKRL